MSSQLPARIESAFEGQPLATFTLHGKPCWIARDVGRALGYSDDGSRLAKKVAGDWSDEMIEGQDFNIVSGSDLDALKQLGPDSVPSHTRSIVILFESGVHLVCIKSRSERGKALRRFLADEVLPQLVRTGSYAPAPEPATSPDRERDLRIREGDLLFRIASKLEQFGTLSDASKAELYARCYAAATGESAVALLPTVDPHPHTMTSIGMTIGISAQKVGKIARDLSIFDREPYCTVRLSKSRHSDRQVEQRFFSNEGRKLIETFHRNSGVAP